MSRLPSDENDDGVDDEEYGTTLRGTSVASGGSVHIHMCDSFVEFVWRSHSGDKSWAAVADRGGAHFPRIDNCAARKSM